MIPLLFISAFDGLPRARCVALDSSEVRRKVQVASPLEREVVLVPQGLSKEDTTALASALHADLARDGDAWRLYRSGSSVAALRKADQEWLRQEIAKVVTRVDELAKRYDRSPVTAPYEAIRAATARFEAGEGGRFDTSAMQANELTPGARLLADLLRGAPGSVFAEAVPGSLTIFSNDPAGPERLWTPDRSDLETYDEAQRRFVEWSAQARAQEKIPAAYRWAFPNRAFRPGKRTFQLGIDRHEPEIAVGISIFGPSGDLESNSLMPAAGFAAEAPVARQATSLGKVRLSNEAVATLQQATTGTSALSIESLDPVAHEPLDRWVRDALLAWSNAKGFPRLVACVPDALLLAVPSCIDRGVLDLDELTEVLSRCDCESLIVGKILVVRPRHALQEEALRVDRRPFAALFQAASRGECGLDALLQYHVAYAKEYGRRPIIDQLEQPIRLAFGLSSSEWNLPHPLLTILGRLPRVDRQSLVTGGRVFLRFPAYLEPLYSLASNARTANAICDLARTPARLAAGPQGCWIEGQSQNRTLVRRVSKGYAEASYYDGIAREMKTVKGENIPLDAQFVPFSSIFMGPPSSDDVQLLDRKYRFRWAEERLTRLNVGYGPFAQAGPYTLRERVRESKTPVPLRQVPGFVWPKSER